MSNTPPETPKQSKVIRPLLIAFFILLAWVIVTEAVHDLTQKRESHPEMASPYVSR
jgi:hypothetical protein